MTYPYFTKDLPPRRYVDLAYEEAVRFLDGKHRVGNQDWALCPECNRPIRYKKDGEGLAVIGETGIEETPEGDLVEAKIDGCRCHPGLIEDQLLRREQLGYRPKPYREPGPIKGEARVTETVSPNGAAPTDHEFDSLVYDGPGLVKAEIPEPNWLVPGFVARGVMTMLVGVGKLGKSVLAHQLCVATACGGVWLDQDVPQGRTLYVNFEDPLGLTRSRAVQQFAPKDLPSEYRTMQPPWGTSFNRFLSWLRSYARREKIDLVVIDPLGIAAAWKDENDNAEVGRTCRSIQEVAVHTEAAILVVHHTRKSGGEYGLEVRGGGAIFAGIQGFLSFKRCGEGRYQLDGLDKMPGEHGGEKHLLLKREPQTLTWHVEGYVTSQEAEKMGHLVTVMLAIKKDLGITRKELRADLGLKESTLRNYLKELAEKDMAFEDTRMHRAGDDTGRPPKGLFLTPKGLEAARMEAEE